MDGNGKLKLYYLLMFNDDVYFGLLLLLFSLRLEHDTLFMKWGKFRKWKIGGLHAITTIRAPTVSTFRGMFYRFSRLHDTGLDHIAGYDGVELRLLSYPEASTSILYIPV